MAKSIGQNINENDTGTLSIVSVGSASAVTLLAARTEPLLKVIVTNRGNKDLAVRLYPASTDNTFQGIIVESGETKDILTFNENYTGEISGIMESGGAQDVFVTSI